MNPEISDHSHPWPHRSVQVQESVCRSVMLAVAGRPITVEVICIAPIPLLGTGLQLMSVNGPVGLRVPIHQESYDTWSRVLAAGAAAHDPPAHGIHSHYITTPAPLILSLLTPLSAPAE
ncbi:unnamed protein product [Danaus chrysippus]|uniref:(African queen) hypothetical protein n=1 Tax=Danaus chrysippus TaxID=151541 RepID=A0A8J2QMA6_9NEOP|nr:unnamed protein product [Danaus chrysippus]